MENVRMTPTASAWAVEDLDPTAHPDTVVQGRPVESHHQLAKKTITDKEIRCSGEMELPGRTPGRTRTCRKLLAAMAGRPWEITCPRCGTTNRSPAIP